MEPKNIHIKALAKSLKREYEEIVLVILFSYPLNPLGIPDIG